MNMLTKRLGTAALLACGWIGAAQAVSLDGEEGPYVGGGYLMEFGDGDRDSDLGQGGQLQFGWDLESYGFEQWSVETTLHALERDRDIDGKPDYQRGVMLDLVRDFGMYGWEDVAYAPRFKPFVLGGLGVVFEDVRGDEHNHFGINLGAGALFPLDWHRLAVRLEGRVLAQDNGQSVPTDEFLFDYRIGLGLQYPLGHLFASGEAEVDDALECDVAVVDPETGRSGCESDSDRDGVLDSQDQCPGTPDGTRVDGKGCPVDLTGDQDGDGVPDADDRCPDTQARAQVDATGCIVAQTLVLRGVFFANDSAVLSEEARGILDGAADSLRAQANVQVEIGGHTDSNANDAYNLELSQQRAESVRQYLIEKGVGSERLFAVGYGESVPVADNATADGRAENRRVEFKLIVQ